MGGMGVCSLNCASISADGALVAGGFSDSSLKVWFPCKFCIPETHEDGHMFDWGLASYGR